MKKFYKRNFTRNDKKKLILFSYKEHTEKPSKELEITTIPKPHLRWNPSRQEWVTYSAGRKNRTSFPPKEYCPLCPGANLNFPTEIPFSDFEIAVFPNRWSSFNSSAVNVDLESLITKPSKGVCEVVVYTSEHLSTIAELEKKKVRTSHICLDR